MGVARLFSMHNLVIMLLAVGCIVGSASAQILSGQATTPPTAAAAPEAADNGFWGWLPKPEVTWPKVALPTITWPKLDMSSAGSSALAPIKASASKVTSGAKKAWEGTKELFSFASGNSSQPDARVASRPQPSIWQRMFGSPAQDQGPQTIGEFMAGTRPK